MACPENAAPVACHDYVTQRLADLRRIHTPEGIEALEPVEILPLAGEQVRFERLADAPE
jgi:hypothetical protein